MEIVCLKCLYIPDQVKLAVDSKTLFLQFSLPMSGTLIKRTGPLWPNYRGNFSTHAIKEVVWAIG